MYLVYSKAGGYIWRAVGEYEKDGDEIRAGFNGQKNLIYPASVNVDVLEITQEELNNLVPLEKYKVENGAVVVREEYAPTENELEEQLTNSYAEGVDEV